MQKKKRFLSLLLAIVMLLLAACGGGGGGDKPADDGGNGGGDAAAGDTIKIGVISSTTGNFADRAPYQVEALELAVEEINAAGGVLGKPIELVIEDDQSDQTQAVNMMNKIGSDSSIVAVFGPHTSTNAVAVSSSVEQYGIPYFTGGTSAQLRELGNEYMFMIRANDRLVAEAAVRYAVDAYSPSKVGILYINDEFGVGGRNIMVDFCEANGLEYVEANHNATDQDLTAQILQMQEAGVDVLIGWCSNVCPVLARQSSELGFDKPVIMNSGFGGQDVLDSLSPEVTIGKMACCDFTAEDPDPAAKEFVDKYVEKFGRKPLGDWSASYYGGMRMLAEAIEQAGSADRAAIKDAMYAHAGYEGPLGLLQSDKDGVLVHQASIIVAAQRDDGSMVFDLVEKITEEVEK